MLSDAYSYCRRIGIGDEPGGRRRPARHPSVAITAAIASGRTAAARPLPALSRRWHGTIVPLAPETLATDADIVFLALPDAAAAELAPALVDAGVRVVDLSGAFRLRDAAVRSRWYP